MMKKGLFVVVMMLGASLLLANQTSVVNVTHGEFSVLLLKALSTKQPPQLTPDKALARVQKYGLMPSSWLSAGLMTHAELAQVFKIMGVSYIPADPKAPVSKPFAEAILRRYLGRIRAYRGWLVSSGFSSDDAFLDGNHGEAVSPSKF